MFYCFASIGPRLVCFRLFNFFDSFLLCNVTLGCIFTIGRGTPHECDNDGANDTEGNGHDENQIPAVLVGKITEEGTRDGCAYIAENAQDAASGPRSILAGLLGGTDSKQGLRTIHEEGAEDDEDDASFNNDFSNENDEKSREVTENQRNIITSLIGTLSDRERDIVENYYGINDKKELTLTDIGKKYNLSSERVRQIKLNAIRKLRSKILLYDDLEDLFVQCNQ